ncbi:MAG: hypothetical protein OHK0011_12980 [Turneriella sp.]
MLRYLFGRLWNNPLSRYGILTAGLLISFALIFSARHRLAIFVTRLFTSPDWSDVARHASRPYAFEENEKKAQSLTANAWNELYALAREKNGGEERKDDALFGMVAQRPYSAFLRRHAEEEIFTLLNALAKDCGSLLIDTGLSRASSALGEVAEANTAAGRVRRAMPDTIRDLLKIYTTRIEAALQKKPDYIPAIELAEEVFRGTCSMRDIATLYARAIDYREYYLQKQLYDQDNGKLYNRNPEEFHARAQDAYARDTYYRDLLRRHFQATRFRTPYHPAQLKNLREAYARLRTQATTQALVRGLLAEARHGNPEVARKCHYELFALDYPGITDDMDYVFALAETALRGGENVRAQNILSNALKSKQLKDAAQRREFERLAFGLELHLHESENLSRF